LQSDNQLEKDVAQGALRDVLLCRQDGRYRAPKNKATSAKAAIVAANARLATFGPASVEITPIATQASSSISHFQMAVALDERRNSGAQFHRSFWSRRIRTPIRQGSSRETRPKVQQRSEATEP